ncbi:hypothetical protein QAD02_022348 [Eretmocerus hayati]|uniref:Uncharacterized protein n=1 Tax=Eretmocerus hayati TaxID=131215 RepID=A0ACC2PV91_9HYME|nr:hypothetical protein QAD02_022348 [Eretmocerus hayati]
MDLKQATIKYSYDLYQHNNINRVNISIITNSDQRYIQGTYEPDLLSQLKSQVFHNIEPRAHKSIVEIFERNLDPFEIASSEDKRSRLYIRMGLYEQPILLTVQKKSSHCNERPNSELTESKILYLAIEKSFTKLLQMEGLLAATIAYKDHLGTTKGSPYRDHYDGEVE